MKGMFGGLIAVVCLFIAGFCFYMFGKSGNNMYIVGTVVFGILMAIFGVMFLSGRVNKTEDIHITE